MESPDYYITINEAVALYGADPKAMRREATNRGWGYVKYNGARVAFDLDEFQDWLWGIDEKTIRRTAPRETCLCCGGKARYKRRFCSACIYKMREDFAGSFDEHSVAI